MEEPSPGLYETLVTEQLQGQLERLGPQLEYRRRPLDPADAPDRIAWYVAHQVQAALKDLNDSERVRQGLQVARAVLDQLVSLAKADPAEAPADPASVLQSILGRLPGGQTAELESPLIPLLDTTLLTNAPGEPVLGRQLQSEIASADGIDLVMAFIRRTGITPFLPALRRHCQAGRELRVLTTTYMNVTERRALDELAGLGAQVKVSYDADTTRLHAKAWVFHRHSGFSTAYVGSSNLSRAAQVTGLEWNVRVSQARNPALVDKFVAVFESYWQRGDFVPYRPEEFDEQQRQAGVDGTGIAAALSPIELRPEPFQRRLLELIEVARSEGQHRNLLVAATGTGKTVMAALDYAALRQRLPRARLLFIAHRAEILDQSRATFRYALREPTFGERWVGGSHPHRFDHVFASVQSLNAQDLGDLDPRHFDVVIIDEFHHA
ncbi:MAG: DEAD/DEAH box helicase family protein, partial [Actinomycetota bacterium]